MYLHQCLNCSAQRIIREIPTWSWARWSLQLNIEIARVKPSPIQPPLIITAHGGRIIDTSSDILSIESWTTELAIEGTDTPETITEDLLTEVLQEQKLTIQHKVRVAEDTQVFYTQEKLHNIDDRSSSLQAETSTALLVRGILLTLPAAISELEEKGAQTREPNARVIMSVPLSDVEWRNDGHIGRIGAMNRPPVLYDFLFVATRFSRRDRLVVQLLHLYWEQGVAYRGGTVDIYIEMQHVVAFWYECQARTCCFWLD